MNLLWLTWKDKKNPSAGGAETVNEELAKRLVKNGHRVVFIVSGFEGGAGEEIINGCKVIRVGSRFTVYWQAYRYYKRYLKGKFDLVIDEMNTIPFFAKFYVQGKNILFVHQLCREIWFYEIFFPLNIIGYLLEPFYLRLLSDRKVITISQSTKNDLLRFGFRKENIFLIPLGIDIEPLETLPPSEKTKEKEPTILYLGSLRRMKRPDEVIRAFIIAKKEIPNLKLWVAGEGKQSSKLKAQSSKLESVTYFGKVNKKKKVELLQKAHLICATSVKEGWGLVVTEANSQGTPAIVYNVDGLRDSVKNRETGFVCEKNTPDNFARNIIELFEDREEYNKLRQKAWEWSREINFDKSYEKFIKFIKLSS